MFNGREKLKLPLSLQLYRAIALPLHDKVAFWMHLMFSNIKKPDFTLLLFYYRCCTTLVLLHFFCFALKEWHYQCSIIFDQPFTAYHSVKRNWSCGFFDLICHPSRNSISTVSRPECLWGAMHNLIIDETHLLQPPSSVRSCVNVKAPRTVSSTRTL